MSLHNYILLIFILAFTLIGLRLVLIFAATQMACTEMLVSFGATDTTPPVFTNFLYVSYLLIAYSLAVTYNIRARLTRWPAKLFQGILIAACCLLAFGFYQISSDDYHAPDGTLATEEMIWSEQAGRAVASYSEHPYFEFYWRLGPLPNSRTYERETYSLKSCVWENESLIADSHKGIWIDNYADMNRAERLRALKIWRENRPIYWVDWPPDLIDFPILGERALIKQLMNEKKLRRPMTPEERDRFAQKKACLADITNFGKSPYICDWVYTFKELDITNWPDAI